VATSPPDRTGSSDWSQLEQSFFEAAPPDVAVAPPPAPTFDDLGPVLPERRKKPRAKPVRSPRVATKGQSKGKSKGPRLASARVWPARLRPLLVRCLALLTRVRPAFERARPALGRARAWGEATARDASVRLVASVRHAKESTRPALREALARIVAELPGERPDGRTVVATLVAIVVLTGLSATVLGSRAAAWLPPPAPVASAPAPTP
jgi:hypothetical protein